MEHNISAAQTNLLHPRQTHWHVLTGAPCAGKTTLIEELARRGYRVVHEVARAFIDSQLALGRTLAQIKADPADFERSILLKKIEIEKELPADELIFLDRALPDSIAYYQAEGLDPGEPLFYSRAVRYRSVFFLERLLFQKDAVRSESETIAARLDRLVAQTYTDLGYDLILVPVLPIEQRADVVLKTALARSNRNPTANL